jgi:branched-chain amino acid transport system permease protein
VTRATSLGALAVAAGVVALPFAGFSLPGAFDGPLDSPGTLNVLALCCVFGALALTYDLVFGFVGLLSFGHALYFAIGAYVTAIALVRFHLPLPEALLCTALVSVVAATILGAVALRVRDVPFAMVTLAFAEAGSILVLQNPYGLTGGEEGLALGGGDLPAALVGVANTRNLYWLALAFLAAVFAIGYLAVNSPAGRVWQAIRENEKRVGTLGIDPYPFKLGAFVLSAFLAGACGVVYLFLQGGANPGIASANFTLALLVMVVLGGVGTLWGAVLGGVAYEYLDVRLVALSNAGIVQTLPAFFRVPLSEPLFLLGALFIVLVLFLPGGLAGALSRIRRPVARSTERPSP